MNDYGYKECFDTVIAGEPYHWHQRWGTPVILHKGPLAECPDEDGHDE